MPYLSRDVIEKIAERVVCQYKKIYVPERHMCYMVDATELAEMLGFKIEYVNITRDGSILGQTYSVRPERFRQYQKDIFQHKDS